MLDGKREQAIAVTRLVYGLAEISSGMIIV